MRVRVSKFNAKNILANNWDILYNHSAMHNFLQISAASHYGLLLLESLADHYAKGEPLSLHAVAQEKKILSEGYLEEIILPLRKAKLVESVRGRNGGYRLTKDPTTITIYSVLEILEGSLAPVQCLEKDAPACSIQPNCLSQRVWKDMQSAVATALSNLTLADLFTKRKPIKQSHKK